MNYILKITDKYLNQFDPILFELEKNDGTKIDDYVDLLYSRSKLRIKNIPKFIKHVLDESYDYNGSGFSFGPVSEGSKCWVNSDMVEFYVNDYKRQYTKAEVLKFTLELARKSLEATILLDLKEKKLVNEDWIQKIIGFIPLLEVKFKNIV